ncbi:MAG TPA: hypothetical protein PKE21_13700 [Flavobacteriales bacterium]|nr:hypothetical protein [Flavobacteriales bacterium]HMR28531.1 hypothetical protein [Flavobacteriales bacterium]
METPPNDLPLLEIRLASMHQEAEEREKDIEARMQWLALNVRHPDWERAVHDLHSARVDLHLLRRRITNLQEGEPEYGHALPTAHDPRPNNNPRSHVNRT